jgi:hypothetical protein
MSSEWRAYLDTLTWAKGSLDHAAYHSFVRAASLGISRGVALDEVAARINAAGYSFPVGKLERQLAHAYAYVGNSKTSHPELRDPSHCHYYKWPERDYKLLEQIVFEYPGVYDIWEQSPVRFVDEDAYTEYCIDCLFPGNPLLCAGQSSSKFQTKTRQEWRRELSSLQLIVPSAMSAPLGLTKDKHYSAHSLANTGLRMYLVVECDYSPKNPEWAPHIQRWLSKGISIGDACASVLWYLHERAPLTMVVSSGGKSLHGWFNSWNVEEKKLRHFAACAYRLGGDLATFRNPSQFVRMPDGTRDTGARQTVYYLNVEKCVCMT